MAGFAMGASAHADIFLKLDGIEGESEDDKHKKEIQLLTFSFGATQPGSAGHGGGAGVGRAQMHDFEVSKYVDKASPKLFEACAAGTHTANALLVCRKAGGTQQEYLKVLLKDVIISSIRTASLGGEHLPTENISLTYSFIKIDYAGQDAKGGLTGTISGGWDVKANKKV